MILYANIVVKVRFFILINWFKPQERTIISNILLKHQENILQNQFTCAIFNSICTSAVFCTGNEPKVYLLLNLFHR